MVIAIITNLKTRLFKVVDCSWYDMGQFNKLLKAYGENMDYEIKITRRREC